MTLQIEHSAPAVRTGILPAHTGGNDGLKKKATEHTDLTMDRDPRIEKPWNYFKDVYEYHRHILHDLMALKIEGTAPHSLDHSLSFEPNFGHSDGPFLIYHNGSKRDYENLCQTLRDTLI